MTGLLTEMRHAIRTVWMSPGYAVVAVLVLGIGVGANSAMFSVADALVLRPIDLPRLDRLVSVMETELHQVGPYNELSVANYLDWKREARSFDLFAVMRIGDFNLAAGGQPENLMGAGVTSDFFAITGLQPAVGRWFLPEETADGADGRVAVLSYNLWTTRFGGDSGIVGQTIRMNGKDYVVTGVAPRTLTLPMHAQVWTPLIFSAEEKKHRSGFHLFGVALLKAGVPIGEARADLQGIASNLERLYPDTNTGRGASVLPLAEFVTGPTRDFIGMQMGAAAFVLLIACANIANLQLAQAVRRRKEMAVRAALGASRGRILVQLLLEGLVVALGGAVAGILFAQWGIDTILAAMPAEVVRFVSGWENIALDWRTLAFTLTLAVTAALLTSLAPAARSSRPDLQSTLRETSSGSGSAHRLRHMLVVGEVALAVVLMSGAAMMATGFRSMLRAGEMHSPQSLLSFRLIAPRLPDRAERERKVQRHEILRQQLAALPGVTGAAAVSMLPYSGRSTDEPVRIEGDPPRPVSEAPVARMQAVTPDYFGVMRVPVLEGRAVDSRDTARSEKIVVVSASFVRRYLGTRNPIGVSIRLGGDTEKRRIAGVVGDVIHHWFVDKEAMPTIYAPYSQWMVDSIDFAIRTSDSPLALAPAVRNLVRQMDPEQPVAELRTLERGIYEHFTALRYTASLMTAFGVLATLLACIGIYGVISYVVAERTHEIGIRMALGASTAEVGSSVLRRSARLVGTGLAIGVVGAMALSRLLSELIYGIKPADLTPYAATTLLFLVVGLLAAWIPARRAMTVEPLVALRQL